MHMWWMKNEWMNALKKYHLVFLIAILTKPQTEWLNNTKLLSDICEAQKFKMSHTSLKWRWCTCPLSRVSVGESVSFFSGILEATVFLGSWLYSSKMMQYNSFSSSLFQFFLPFLKTLGIRLGPLRSSKVISFF